jgi:hypothetical protein
VCKIPLNLGVGRHTIRVVPTVYSKPLKLTAAVTKFEIIDGLLKFIQEFAFRISGLFFIKV